MSSSSLWCTGAISSRNHVKIEVVVIVNDILAEAKAIITNKMIPFILESPVVKFDSVNPVTVTEFRIIRNGTLQIHG